MHHADAERFTKLLTGVFGAYHRPHPTAEVIAVWWDALQDFGLQAVAAALRTFVRTDTKFPPTPGQILELLGAGRGDGRPGGDEAWAIALSSRDEADTVVWTPEIAEAFGACRPVLDMGDEVGARMAFKDTYTRIVAEARANGKGTMWTVSVGFDPARREAAIRRAESAGLLPAPAVAALLPPPEPADYAEQAAQARANTARLRALLASCAAERAASDERRAAERRNRDRAAKADAAAKVERYRAMQGLAA